MKQIVAKRKPEGIVDYTALALTTWGVGYLPGAPGTYGSVIAVAIYIGLQRVITSIEISIFHTSGHTPASDAWTHSAVAVLLAIFILLGIWAAGRSVELLGNSDPNEAVVDELIGQFVTFLFIPFGLTWPFILAGFILFRIFDIWKPYPINDLQILPGGLGVCADDIVAGVYAGVCLAIGYAVYLALYDLSRFTG